MAQLTGVGHVALWVKDLERTLEFYAKLGCQEMFRMNYSDGTLYLAFIRVTDTQYIELFPEDSVENKPRGKMGMHHFCLTVDDVDAYVEQLEQKGLKMTRGVSKGGAGCRQGWIADPDGNMIEVMEMLPECAHFIGLDRMRRGEKPLHFDSTWPRS